MHVQIDIFLRLFLLHASLAFHRGHPTRTGATQPRAFAESGQECVRGRFHRVPVVATRERPLRVRSNPRPPDRSPSDEPAAPHPVFPPFAVAAGPRTPTDVIPNKFVEANGAAREVLEKGFRFTPRNLGIFAVFGIAVPVLIYKGCVDEFVRAQDSLRDELSSDSPPFFSLAADPRTIPSPNGRGKTRLTAFRSLAKCRPDPEQRYTDKKYGRPEKKFM